MSATASLELPVELKDKIERVARERNEDPVSLIASAVESLLGGEEAQRAEVRRRDLADSGEHYDNEAAFAKLDSFRPSRRHRQRHLSRKPAPFPGVG
jgi:predicted transcriptional regulator